MRPRGKARSLRLIALVLAACTTPVTTPQLSVPTPDMTLTETQTEGSAEAGTIETALGTLSWRHLIGDENSLPSAEFLDLGAGLVALPSGYATIGFPNGGGVGGGLQYWHSPDGYEWTPEPFPVPMEAEYARLEELGGGYWLTTSDPTSVWHSDNGETWFAVPLPHDAEPESFLLHDIDGTIWLTSTNPPGVWRLDGGDWARIDTTELTPPDITGVTWSLESWNLSNQAGPATVGAVTLFPWELGASVDYGALGLGGWYGIWDPDNRTMGLWEGGRSPVATLSVEADGNRFIFIDEAGGVVHEITINDDRLDAATLFQSPSFGNFRQLSLGLLDGEGRVTASNPPWGGFDSESDVKLLAVDGRFLAFIQRPGPTGAVTVELWTSDDGLGWSGPQRPGFLPEDGEIEYLLSVRAEGDVVLAEIGVRSHTEVWMSDDGISWTDTGLSLNNGSRWSLMPFGSGGIYVGDALAAYEMFVSTDLRTWERVDTSQLGIPFDGARGNGAGAYAVGDAVFLTLGPDATGTRDMWVLKLDR